MRIAMALCALLIAQNAFAIFGSRPLAGKPYRSTVKLTVYYAGGMESNCTGSLIAPRLVVTAAHCLRKSKQDFSNVKVDIGDYQLVQNANGTESLVFTTLFMQRYDVAKGSLHPKLVKKIGKKWKRIGGINIKTRYDLALLQLNRDVDSEIIGEFFTPIINKQEREAVINNSLDYQYVFVGHGFYGRPGEFKEFFKSGERRYQYFNHITYNTNYFSKHYHSFEVHSRKVDGKETEEVGITTGDSGGPLLVKVNGKWKLLAVAHSGKVTSSNRLTNLGSNLTPITNELCEMMENINFNSNVFSLCH